METTASLVSESHHTGQAEVITFRQGLEEDQDWLYRLFRHTMRDYIDHAWGWDELLQREGFRESLPVQNFQVLLRDGVPSACYYLRSEVDHLLLEMILVEPRLQGQGLGRAMMARIKEQASDQDQEIRLSVLKTNPAVRFHTAQGFHTASEDAHSLKMCWRHDGGRPFR